MYQKNVTLIWTPLQKANEICTTIHAHDAHNNRIFLKATMSFKFRNVFKKFLLNLLWCHIRSYIFFETYTLDSFYR